MTNPGWPRTSRFGRICAMSLLLATPFTSAAQADPVSKARKPASVDDARARIAMYGLLGSPVAYHPELALLRDHHAHTHTGSEPFMLTKHEAGGIAIEGDMLRAVDASGTLHPISVKALSQAGVKSHGALQKLVAQRLVEIAGRKGTAPASAQEAREILEQERDEVEALHRNLSYHPVIELLRRYASTREEREIANAGVFPTSKGPLQFGDRYEPVFLKGAAVSATGLAQLKLNTSAALETYLTEVVARAAGMKTTKPSAEARTQAMDALEAEIAGVETLREVVKAPNAHPDLHLLGQMQQTRAQLNEAPIRLTLATRGTRTLDLVRDASNGRLRLMEVSKNGEKDHADLPTLQRFGLGTRARLDAAVERLMESIAPEDLY